MKDARKRNGIWHADFMIDGVRYRESLHVTDWREAATKVSELKERAEKGYLTNQSRAFSRLPLVEAIDRWLEEEKPRVAERTTITERERSKPIRKYFGAERSVKGITSEDVLSYIRARAGAGIANATINR